MRFAMSTNNFLLVSAALICSALPAFSESLYVKKQQETIHVRLIARCGERLQSERRFLLGRTRGQASR